MFRAIRQAIRQAWYTIVQLRYNELLFHCVNYKLTSLNLRSNSITAEGVTKLTDALKHSECKLTGLDLAWNNITDEGVTQLADALKHSECKLTYLDLADNNITDRGVTQLADAPKHSECN